MVVAYTERAIRVCATLIFSTNDESFLCYVAHHVTRFALQLGIAMEVALGSRANGRVLFQLLDVIESTQFSLFPDTWRERTYREIYNHPVLMDEGAKSVSYDPWGRRKVDPHTASNHSSANRVVPKDMPFGWAHEGYHCL